MTEQFITGIIGAPFGLKGFVKVKPLSGEIDHLLKLESALICKDGRQQTLAIEESAAAPPYALIRFAGYNSPEAAKALGGAQVLVSRKDAASLREGEFYIEDLKGLDVYACGEKLGSINSVIEGGGGEIAEIRMTDGTLKLVPFREEFFLSIDMENRQAALANLWILE